MSDTLAKLHTALAEQLLARIESGEATAADFQAAAKFLKDNGIDADASKNPGLNNLNTAMKFPFSGLDDLTDGRAH